MGFSVRLSKHVSPILMLTAWFSATPLSAANFICTNSAAEIRCSGASCEVVTPDKGFTPMELRRTGNMLSICAYSGCWEGRIITQRTLDGVSVMQARLKPSTPDQNDGSAISVIYNEAEKVAQMHWNGFANAMMCKVGG
jgi:hypothetical protein